MSFWIEHDAEGRVFQLTEGVEAPQPFFGGTVVEIERRVNTGTVLYLDGELVEFGPPPGERYMKDAATRTWVLVGTTALALAQAAKWAEIKAEREARTFGGFEWSGHTFDSDAVSAQKIAGAAQLAQLAISTGSPFTRVWTLADNTTVSLNAQEMIGVMLAMGEHVGTVHDTGTALRAEIYAADATEASVAAVAWPEEEVTP
ncbi:MAG: hypothetical protein DI587_38855 [Variovorax paradoxus]|nr:MAG: hypothetical protein DI583_38855 [Variovorax paradoxus]PZP99099.1 MAG: hypothetical protein DI587_38855 [Variovorax paradoxus]